MTNERAIELLQRISDSQFDGEYGDERREALDMAVRALSGDGDTISRKDAIDAVNKLVEWYKEKWHESRPTSESVIDVLNDLPSAQPVNYGSTKSDSSSQLKLNNDLISRQQAIDALDKHIDTFDAIDTNYLCGLRTAMSILKEMPSAQPETHDKRTETHECDLINRQQAIDAVVSAMIDGADAELVEGVMELLPSAQPEIIRCTECKHYREYDSKYVENAVVVQCMADRYPISEIIPDGWFCAGAERKDDE